MENYHDNEQDILRRLKLGRQEAFSLLYAQYSDKLLYYIQRTTKSPYLAEDVVYETFMKLWQHRMPFDVSFANNALNQEYRLKIKSEDFVSANTALENEAVVGLQEVDPEHYLFDFSNEELMQLIAKRDEWSDFDFLLAKKILEQRNVNLDMGELAHIQEKRLEELSKPEKVSPGWIYAGFLFAL